MLSFTIYTQQTTVVSTTTTTAPVKPHRHRATAQTIDQQWQLVQATNIPATAPPKPPRLKGKKVLSEEEIREQMGAVGRAIEDHPNIYAGVTIVGVLSAFYGLCANIVGREGVNLALTRALTNLTNCF